MKIAFHLPIEIKPLIVLVDYLLDFYCPTRLSAEGEIRELALRGEIKKDHYNCLTKMHGFSPYFSEKLLHAGREKLGHHEIIEYYRRHFELQNKTEEKLKQIGLIDDEERYIIEDLYNEIFDIKTHFEWLRRNADSPLFVAEFGLWQGFDTRENIIAFYTSLLNDNDVSAERKAEIQQAIPIITAQPINPALALRNYWNTYGKDISAKGCTYKNLFGAYVAHFIPVPREMGYEFVQRLRPGRVPNQLVFTTDTLRRVLNEQDIDPNMIDRYIYCSYRTLNQRYLQMLAKMGLIDEAEIAERLQDIGFDPASSKLLAHGLELQRRNQVATEVHGWNAANMIEAFKEKLVTEEMLTKGLQYLGFTAEDIDGAIGVANSLHHKKVKSEWQGTIERAFKRGYYTAQAAAQALVDKGYDTTQADDLINLWTVQLQLDIHNPDSKELISAYIDGFMSADEVATRLVRMNYSYESIGLMLSTAYMKITEMRDKDQEKQQKLKDAAAKELAKQIKEQQKKIYRQEKIHLNIAKAIERSQLILLKQGAKDAAKVAKDILKLSTIAGLAKSKDATSQKLLQIALKAKDDIQAIKDKLAIDLVQTSDKVQKATLKNDAADKIKDIKAQAQKDADEVKSQAELTKSLAAQAGVIGPIPTPQPSEQTIAGTEATQVVADAVATGAVDSLGPG